MVAVRLRAAQKTTIPEECKKEKIRRYSPGPLTWPYLPTLLGVTEDRILGGLGRAGSAYRSRRDLSAARRRDGAISDFMDNVARVPEEFIVEISKMPRDLISSRTHKRMRRRVVKPIFILLRW